MSEPSSPPDLAAIDLTLSFAPSWAKETDTSKQIAKLAAKHGGGDDRGDSRGGKRWEDRGPRPDRGPRREGGGQRPGGKRPGGVGGRPDRFERRDERPERAPRPEPALLGWTIQFLPDRHGVDGLAKQIKGSAKAYPLFDLARLVLEKSERYLVEFKRADAAAPGLFQLRVDGSVWLSEADAIAHALARHLDKFYRRERVSVDPPKGTYPFVAVCGMSGTLLGPPNYHDYQTKIRQLHAERFSNVPFEVFKSRIRMDREEESVAKWKEEQSSRDVYFPIEKTPPPAPAASPTPSPETPPPVSEVEASELPAAESSPEESTPEVTAPSEQPEASAETPAEDSAPVPVEKPAGFATLADVERDFREKHAANAVVKIRDRVVVPGPAALNDSAPTVLLLTRGLWEQIDRFPLPLAHNLGQQLVGRGLHIFKAHDNITYVGVARPRYLDRQATPVAEGLSGILDYLEGHSSTPRAEQLQALVAQRPAPADTAEEDDREAAVARDLSWLLHEGHVVDYAKRGLEAARRPKPPTPKSAGKRRADSKVPSEATASASPSAEPAPSPEPVSPSEPAGPAVPELAADEKEPVSNDEGVSPELAPPSESPESETAPELPSDPEPSLAPQPETPPETPPRPEPSA